MEGDGFQLGAVDFGGGAVGAAAVKGRRSFRRCPGRCI